jgi:hypothetical protein
MTNTEAAAKNGEILPAGLLRHCFATYCNHHDGFWMRQVCRVWRDLCAELALALAMRRNWPDGHFFLGSMAQMMHKWFIADPDHVRRLLLPPHLRNAPKDVLDEIDESNKSLLRCLKLPPPPYVLQAANASWRCELSPKSGS